MSEKEATRGKGTFKTCNISQVEKKYNSFDPYLYHYFNELNHQRRDYTFKTFVNRTDEKEQTEKALKQFIGEYLSRYIKDCKVLDFGPGEGDLAVKNANIMKEKCKELLYAGIDRSELFVNITKEKLDKNKVENQIVVGNMFKEDDLKQLPNKATTVLASQVAFYALKVIDLVGPVVNKFEKAAFIIVQTNTSFLHKMVKQYGIGKQKIDIVEEINKALQEYPDVVSKNVIYPSSIDFPKINLDSLLRIAGTPYDKVNDKDDKIARDILEFVAGNSMDCLVLWGLLEEFIYEVQEHLRKNDNKILFWNSMSLILQTKDISQKKLQEFWQKLEQLKYSNDYNPLEQAISEGNIDIARTLAKEGLVIVEEEKEFSYLKVILHPFVFLYELKEFFYNKKTTVSNIFVKQSSLVQIAVDKNDTESIQYLLSELKTTADIKQFTYQYNEKSVFLFMFSGGVFNLVGLLCIYLRVVPTEFKGIYSYGLMAATTGYAMVRYYNSGDSNLQVAIKNNNNNLAKIIFLNGHDINKHYTGERKTVLHTAVEKNNTELALLFLKSGIFDLNQPDIYGFTCLNYAIANNNKELFFRFRVCR